MRREQLIRILLFSSAAVIAIVVLLYFYLVDATNRLLGGCSLEGTRPFPQFHGTLLDELETAHKEIRAEVDAALAHFSPIKNDLFFRQIADDNWKKIYLKWYGEAPEYAYSMFPRTMALVDAHPEVRLAMFSMLEPGAIISPHRGPYRGCLRVHLGITTPNSPKCFINVGGTDYHWRDGRAVAFDDTYRHYVHNDTDKTRIILFLDVERTYSIPTVRHLNRFIMRRIAPMTGRVNEDLVALHSQRKAAARRAVASVTSSPQTRATSGSR